MFTDLFVRRLACARTLILAAVVALPLAGGAYGEELDEELENDAIVYAWDNAVFTLYHEIGHMLVDLYELPVLSKEEDAVDNLATLMALEDYNRDGDPIVIDAANGWLAWMNAEDLSGLEASDFFDEHSVSAQRAYQMICLLVGSDKDEFGAIADEFGLDDDRQDRCSLDFEQAQTSWDTVLADYREENTGDPLITIDYQDAGDETRDARDILIDNEVLETVAASLEKQFTLPREITFEATDCGTVNAYYSSDEAKITLCYEIVQQYFDQYREDLLAGRDPSDLGNYYDDDSEEGGE